MSPFRATDLTSGYGTMVGVGGPLGASRLPYLPVQTSTSALSRSVRLRSSGFAMRRLFRRTGFWLAVAGISVSSDWAQTIPARRVEAADDPVTELSPFVVREGSDIGYVGAQSLLGSRLKQELRDIPAQIEVFTPEFLLDFDLTRAEDAFKYSASVENSQEFVSPTDGGGAMWSSQTNGRIRGLLPSSFTISREMFSSIITADSYNLDRVELASGAQSLLFSLGEPAGMANMSLKRAQMAESPLRRSPPSQRRPTARRREVVQTRTGLRGRRGV